MKRQKIIDYLPGFKKWLHEELVASLLYDVMPDLINSYAEPVADVTQLQPGDHVTCPTKFPTILHHGIFLGEGKMVHFDGHSKKVEETDIIGFSKRELVKLAYEPTQPVDRVIDTAKELVKTEEFARDYGNKLDGKPLLTRYAISTKNCEHLAWFCRTGFWISHETYDKAGVANNFSSFMKTSMLGIATLGVGGLILSLMEKGDDDNHSDDEIDDGMIQAYLSTAGALGMVGGALGYATKKLYKDSVTTKSPIPLRVETSKGYIWVDNGEELRAKIKKRSK